MCLLAFHILRGAQTSFEAKASDTVASLDLAFVAIPSRLLASFPLLHRYDERLQSVVGMFVNVLPVRLRASHGCFIDCVHATQHAVVQALQHSHVPFHRIVAASGASRSTAYNPLVQVFFQVNAKEPPLKHLTIKPPRVKADLEVKLFHDAGKVSGAAIYDQALYEESTLRAWVSMVILGLESAVKTPEARWSGLFPLSSAAGGTASTEGIESKVAFWRARIMDADLPTLELPFDRPRQLPTAFDSNVVSVVFPEKVTASFDRASRAHDCTLYEATAGLWALLLCRHARQEEVAMRTCYRADDSDLVYAAALRVMAPRNLSVAALLQGVHRTVEEAAQYALPFPGSVSEVLFDVQMPTALAWGIGADGLGKALAETDVALVAHMNELGCLEIDVQFNVGLFERDTIERLSTRLLALATAIANASAEEDTWGLQMMPAAEIDRLVISFNEGDQPYLSKDAPYPTSVVHELFTQQVQRTPEASALELGSSVTTYSELHQRANLLAVKLSALGAGGRDIFVAILAPRGVEFMVGVWGTLLAGSAFVPIDVTYPEQRISWMLEDAAPPVCALTKLLEATVPKTYGGRLYFLESSTSSPSATHIAPTACHNSSCIPPTGLPQHTDAMVVIFTSGSTGRPKGTVLEHGTRCTSTRPSAVI